MIEDTADWPSGPVRIVWHDSTETDLPITGAHGFCFHKARILVCDIAGRGLTIPGGHLDEAEKAADCLIREALEEACVSLYEPMLLGFIEADHRSNTNYSGPHPLRSVQAIYRADVRSVSEFIPEHESRSRRFLKPEALPALHHEWNDVLQAALDAATQK